MDPLTGLNGTPSVNMGWVNAPTAYTGKDQPNNAQLSLGDMSPGDSIVVQFLVRTAGPVWSQFDASYYNCGSESFNCRCYRYNDGVSLSGAADAYTYWEGCPAGIYSLCDTAFPQKIYNGRDALPVAEYNSTDGYAHFISRFRNFGAANFVDSTATNRCAYFDLDTLKLRMQADVMDLPFFTAKSKFSIKVKCTDGVQWDGNLNAVFCRLPSWSATAAWPAYKVVDSMSYDSTIRVYFRYADLPVTLITQLNANAYNSYQGGAFPARYSSGESLPWSCGEARPYVSYVHNRYYQWRAGY